VTASEAVATANRDRPAERHVTHVETLDFGPGTKVHRFRYPNGLTLLCEVDPSAPVVALQTWVKVGSRMERPGKTGICHLFEHLMFGETEERPHGAFDRLLEEAGAENNAATYVDWTFYQQNLPREALQLGLSLESSRFEKLVLQDQQVTSEKGVVANERRQRVDDSIDGFMNEVLFKEAFRVHGYGIPTIGWMEDIEGFTPDDCLAFYRTYYAPNNSTLVLVGDLALEETLGLVADTFGALSRSTVPEEASRPEPPQEGERRVVFEKPTDTVKIAIGYKCPAISEADHPALVVANEILFGGRAGRVHKRLVKERELASEVQGSVGFFEHPGLYEITLAGREEVAAEDLLAELDLVLEAFVAEPVSEAELERAKARLELETVQSLESASGRAETLGFYETVLGDPAALFGRLVSYRAVSSQDVLGAARAVLVRAARTVVEVHPDGSSLDEDDDPEDDEAEDGEGDET
jgi:zinc protease